MNKSSDVKTYSGTDRLLKPVPGIMHTYDVCGALKAFLPKFSEDTRTFGDIILKNSRKHKRHDVFGHCVMGGHHQPTRKRPGTIFCDFPLKTPMTMGFICGDDYDNNTPAK